MVKYYKIEIKTTATDNMWKDCETVLGRVNIFSSLEEAEKMIKRIHNECRRENELWNVPELRIAEYIIRYIGE